MVMLISINGDPVRPMPLITDKKKNDFWLNVAITANDEKCWNWEGCKSKQGYGQFSIKQSYPAHRLSFFINNNVDPLQMLVCHTCDNTSCVNPKHLFLGTNQDNVDDKMKKGRLLVPGGWSKGKENNKIKGAGNGSAKLTEDQVIQIKKEYKKGSWKFSSVKLGKKYNVESTAILNIVNGKTWTNIK